MFKKNTKRRDKEEEAPVGKRRSRHLDGIAAIDFRDSGLLRKFITEQGKIMPARFTGTSAKQQRQIARAIRRSRVIGFMP